MLKDFMSPEIPWENEYDRTALHGPGSDLDHTAPVFIAKLEDEHSFVRSEAAERPGYPRARPAEVVPKWIELLDDNRMIAREAAAWALGRFGKSAAEAVPKLARLLDDDYASVRDAARKSMTQIAASSQ